MRKIFTVNYMKKYHNKTKKQNLSNQNKINSKSDRESKSNKDSSNTSSNMTDEEKEELIKQIGILDLSAFGIYLIIYAAIINIKYLSWQKIRILDSLNTTNYSEGLQDLTEVPKKANMIYLFVISIFVGILFDNYRTAASKTEENRSEEEIQDRYKNLIAILLMLLGTTINFEVLNC